MAASSESYDVPVFLLGLSGPSGSGKTTLAYLLRHVFPNVIEIVHADDFCKDFENIPMVNGYLDCDGPDGLDVDRMIKVLSYVKKHGGNLPSNFRSWQDDVFPGREKRAFKMVSPQLLHKMQRKVEQSGLDVAGCRIVIVEGFLLYHNATIRDILDARLFLRLSRKTAKDRRMTRPGYGVEAKPDEFWKSEDYFEKMVWRSYLSEHSQFFENGDVEGKPNEKCVQSGIDVQSTLDVTVDEALRWATDALLRSISMRFMKETTR